MFGVKIISSFSAAHYLRGYKGKCENLHGHNWKVEVEVFKSRLTEQGMVVDFSRLKKILNRILKRYDHQILNKLGEFRKKNPTSENMAIAIHKKIRDFLPSTSFSLIRVYVWEKEDSCAIYEA